MIGFAGRKLAELYRRGFALFVLAPVIVAIVVLPEFAQHVVEIKLGMFENAERAHAVAADPMRWALGDAKLAGLLIAMLAAARYWAAKAWGGSWWRIGNVAWVQLIVAILLFTLLPLPFEWLHGHIPDAIYWTAYTAVSIAVLPLMFPILAALFGDRRHTLAQSFMGGWRWLPLLLLLLVAAYLPGFAAHYGLHYAARGLAEPLVWGLMTLDALVIGLLASLVGASLALSYEAAFPPNP